MNCHCRHTLIAQVVACTEVWDDSAGQAGRDPADPKLLDGSSQKAPVWARVVKMRIKGGKKKKKKWPSQEKQHPLK